MKTMREFISESHLPAELIRAVVRQAGGWKSFQEMAPDVTKHGADGGFSGFIYYTDTVKFAQRNKGVILDACRQLADDLGEPVYRMIGGFNCLKITEGEAAEAIHNPRSEDRANVLNAMSWFALEEVSSSYSDLVESQ